MLMIVTLNGVLFLGGIMAIKLTYKITNIEEYKALINKAIHRKWITKEELFFK